MLGVQLVLMLLFGYLGYREAAKFVREHGRPPMGVPPWGWAAITGFSLIIGAVLLAVARRQAAKAPTRAPATSFPPAWATGPAAGATDWATAPAAPPREDLWSAPAPGQPVPGQPVPGRPVPAQQVVRSAASRDILPGR